MKIGTRIRDVVKKLFLRGAILDWWVRWKSRRLEREIVRRFLQVQKTRSTFAAAAPQMAPRPAPRGIAFIADCMWELDNLVPELARIAEVKVLDLRPELRQAGAQSTNEVTAQSVDRFLRATPVEPDVIFFYARPSLLSEGVFDRIRKQWKAPLLGMSLDDKSQFFDYRIFHSGDDNYRYWARFFDLTLSSSLAATECYRALGLPVYYCPAGCRVTTETRKPPGSADFKYQFSFLGSWKVERAAIMDRLIEHGIEIKCFGGGWPQSGWIETPEIMFRQSQLNLGIGFFGPNAVLTNLKARDFECPGAGACYITTYNWELPTFYELGREILCYRSVEELIEMHSYYSKRPELCLQIAQAAHRRCMSDHTWERRFREVLRSIGFKA